MYTHVTLLCILHAFSLVIRDGLVVIMVCQLHYILIHLSFLWGPISDKNPEDLFGGRWRDKGDEKDVRQQKKLG